MGEGFEVKQDPLAALRFLLDHMFPDEHLETGPDGLPTDDATEQATERIRDALHKLERRELMALDASLISLRKTAGFTSAEMIRPRLAQLGIRVASEDEWQTEYS